MAALCTVACAAGLVHAGPRIVNGLGTQAFPTTGALLYSGSPGIAISAVNASSQCTGTLIGCQTFLTAAHCVSDDGNPSHYWVYLQHHGLSTVSSITIHPQYNSAYSGRDVAVLKLAAPVTGISPTPLNTTHDLDALGIGLGGTIAGFGRTGGGSDYGIKNYGAVVTAGCDTGSTGGEGNDRLVCWNYDTTVGPAGDDSNTCNGDSGGPLFMDFSGVREIVGVTSAGTSTDCLPTDHSWDASVYYNRTWIAGELGADSTANCGVLAPVGDADVTVHANSGGLSGVNTSDSFDVSVTGTPQLVRFTLNANDYGFDADFFVKQGTGASAASYDCKADAASAFGACEFASPAGGTWSVFVARNGSGSGLYQVTTTVFGGNPPVCGNNVVEQGEECDGTEIGACLAGPCAACACPAPVCGNDVVEQGEQCDGSSAGACSDGCGGDCTCVQPACSSDDLYGLAIVSDASRFSYKARLYDPFTDWSALDPRGQAFTATITDGSGTVSLAIPAADALWVKADPVRRKYGWKGDGTLDGLRRVRLVYKDVLPTPYWNLQMRGRFVTGAATINVNQTLDFNLGFDGTCHLETW